MKDPTKSQFLNELINEITNWSRFVSGLQCNVNMPLVWYIILPKCRKCSISFANNWPSPLVCRPGATQINRAKHRHRVYRSHCTKYQLISVMLLLISNWSYTRCGDAHTFWFLFFFFSLAFNWCVLHSAQCTTATATQHQTNCEQQKEIWIDC